MNVRIWIGLVKVALVLKEVFSNWVSDFKTVRGMQHVVTQLVDGVPMDSLRKIIECFTSK